MLFGFPDVCFGFAYFEADIEKSASKEKYLKCPQLLTAYIEWYAHRGSNRNIAVILLKRKANVGLTNADGKG